ncbi:hypothetical protein TTRE_0000275601 [Trichuris trichiura]|uniref:Transcriptional repressor p66 coiled-coil MBD2-interaction domain-containing protein n=1 Tax=Trichuris trichiura TaxID=36087 RepID=A0A077Z371_TRITR|nr:hypothetical protein TTRE_0000275601 [Trichuris trichiura]
MIDLFVSPSFQLCKGKLCDPSVTWLSNSRQQIVRKERPKPAGLAMVEDPEVMDVALPEPESMACEESDGLEEPPDVTETIDQIVEATARDYFDASKEKSPNSLRRSQRASARRAQERMRGEFKDMLEAEATTTVGMKRSKDDDSETASELDSERLCAEHPKKRRSANDVYLDPGNSHFAIQEDVDGVVVFLSDDSEVSSFKADELEMIRKLHTKCKPFDLTKDQQKQRLIMINELKAQLRVEEARLIIMKKMRLSQQLPVSIADVVNMNWGEKVKNAISLNSTCFVCSTVVSGLFTITTFNVFYFFINLNNDHHRIL